MKDVATGIEFSISVEADFGEYVEHAIEEKVEAKEPKDKGGDGQLHRRIVPRHRWLARGMGRR